jgi:hypothetical protein
MKRRFLFLLMAVCSFVGANAALNRANNYLEAGDATAEAGKTVVIDILMTSNKTITDWATNLVLPEGITLVSAVAAENWPAEVKIDGLKVGSSSETPVAAMQKQVVAKVTLQVDASVEAGEYEIALAGTVMISDENGGTTITQVDNKVAKLTVTPAQGGIKGDLNDDGFVDTGDIQLILNDMADSVFDAAKDLNDDGFVDTGDIQIILNIMAEL